jgi:outer membrane protein
MFSIFKVRILCVISSFLMVSNLFAQNQPLVSSGGALGHQLKIGVVDVQSAILQTNEGKAAKSKIEKEVEKKRQEILSQQNELKKMEEEFQAQQSILSDADKMSKQKEFQEKFKKYQSLQIGFEQETRQKELAATQQIYQNLITVVQKVAKPKSFDMVFDRGAGVLLYADKVTDITKEVVEQYNKEHKNKIVDEKKGQKK